MAITIPFSNLNLKALRMANIMRLPELKSATGAPAHSQADGSDWTLGEWCNAVCGELGELANLVKKVKRGDISMDDARPFIAKEMADVLTYLDIMAFRADVDLSKATIDKFNEVSIRVKSSVRLGSDAAFREPDHFSPCA